MVAFSQTVRLSSNTKNGEFKLVRIKKEKLDNYNPNVLEIFRKFKNFYRITGEAFINLKFLSTTIILKKDKGKK